MPGKKYEPRSPVVITPPDEHTSLVGYSFVEAFEYYNFTGFDVHVKTVSGLGVKLPGSRGAAVAELINGTTVQIPEYMGCLVIRQVIYCSASQRQEIANNLTMTRSLLAQDTDLKHSSFAKRAEVIVSAFEEMDKEERNRGIVRVKIDYVYRLTQPELNELTDDNTRLVCSVTGTCFDIKPVFALGFHNPEQNELRREDELHEYRNGRVPSTNGLSMSVHIVAPKGVISKKYVRVLNKIHVVQPTTPSSELNGSGSLEGVRVIITRDKRTEGELGSMADYYLPLSECTPENGFYDTYEDAQKGIDPKLRLAENELRSLELKYQNTVQTLEEKREADIAKARAEAAKAETEERKAKSDRIAWSLKSWQDTVKLAVVVIPTALAVGKYVFKFFKGISAIMAAGAAAAAVS